MTDPIKAAMVAATRGFCDAMTGGGCECAQGDRHPKCDMDACAVAAVAAFLRELRPMTAQRIPVGTSGKPFVWLTLDELAAAVELAAQEARDDR